MVLDVCNLWLPEVDLEACGVEQRRDVLLTGALVDRCMAGIADRRVEADQIPGDRLDVRGRLALGFDTHVSPTPAPSAAVSRIASSWVTSGAPGTTAHCLSAYTAS